MQSTKTRMSFATWRNLLDHINLFKIGSTWILGKEQKVKFCYDHWVYNSPLTDHIKSNPHQCVVKEARVSNFITTSKQWNISNEI